MLAIAIASPALARLVLQRLPPAGRRPGVARRRVRPAQRPLRPAAAARARLLRPPADRAADVARDRRPAVGALLPRLRARLHRPVGADDRARGGGDVRAPAGAGRASRSPPSRSSSSSPTATAARSQPALQEVQQRIGELTADAEENISGVRVVKAFAREERQLERFEQLVERVFDQPMFADAAPGALQAADRLPAAPRPRRDPARRRPRGDSRGSLDSASSPPSTPTC